MIGAWPVSQFDQRLRRVLFLWTLIIGGAAPLWAQQPPTTQGGAAATSPTTSADPLVGNWRGALRSAAGAETPFIITIFRKGDAYGGTTTGLAESSEVPLDRVTVSGAKVVVEAAADSRLGRVVLSCELSAEGNRMAGVGTVGVGSQKLDVSIALQRRQRQDVVQPHVEQRPEYFAGTWSFEYLGGEFPPLSQGTRSGTVTFTRVGTSGFLTGVLEGEDGPKSREDLLLGVDVESKTVVYRERHSDGVELVSLGNWQSPLAITFVTTPVVSAGKSYQLRRVISVTSDVAFSVTEEFSVDGGPFRRLGNAQFVKRPD